MRLPTYAIGIDSSATATKAVVWDQDGRSVAEGRCAFPLTKPRPGWHEQDAEDWWRSTIATLRDVAAAVDTRQIGAIGLTHQRETCEEIMQWLTGPVSSFAVPVLSRYRRQQGLMLRLYGEIVVEANVPRCSLPYD